MFIYNVKINGGAALKLLIIVLSIFMLIVFGISVYRIFFLSGDFRVKDRSIANEITKIEPENYANILEAVHNDIDSTAEPGLIGSESVAKAYRGKLFNEIETASTIAKIRLSVLRMRIILSVHTRVLAESILLASAVRIEIYLV